VTKTAPGTFDLVGGGKDHPWSVDLVMEAFPCLLLGGFAFALITLCIY